MMTAVTHRYENASREWDRVLGPEHLLDEEAQAAFDGAYSRLCRAHNQQGGMPINRAERTWKHQMEANLADVMLQQALTPHLERMTQVTP